MPGSLKDAVPAIERITRGPGRILVRNALITNGVLLILATLLARRGMSFGVALSLIFALLGLLATAVFAWRRERLQSAVEKWRKAENSTIDGESNAQAPDLSDHYSSYYAGKSPSNSKDVITINENGSHADTQNGNSSSYSSQDHSYSSAYTEDLFQDRMREAGNEARVRRDTWMPGIEAAQRAAIAAAGGLANAPYLKDDLRITIVSSILAFFSIPIGTFFSFFTILALL